MSIALGALRNRTQLPDGSLVPWTSPLGKPMSIAATVPEYTWSDIAYALTPNGSSLDYVANASYLSGGHRVGVQKQNWNNSLYLAGALLGYYAPAGTDADRADIIGWKTLTDTGGPFDGNPAAAAMVAELTANHSAYYLDDSDRPRPGAAGQRLERRPVPGRRVAALLQQDPREVPEHADLDVPPRLRPQPARRRDLRRRPRRADRGRERLAGLLRQGRRLRARRRARRRRHPHLQVPGQRRRHALPRADLGAARARRDPARRRRGPDDRRARHRAEQRVHLRRRLHHDLERRQRLGRDLQASRPRRRPTRSPARRRSSPSSPSPAPTTWSPRGSTTSTARPSA